MFSSYFSGSSADKDGSTATSSSSSTSASTTGQIHPPKERLSTPEAAFGPLTAQDTAWLCAGGFTTETQTFYTLTAGDQPKLVMVQIIHSAVGMWYPQIQFNMLCFDPATGHKEWRSTSVSGFTTAPTIGSTKYDKRSCKSNEFTFLVDPAKSDTYTIEGKYDANTQVSLKVKRMDGAPGFKLGSGPKGGMTYFGAEKTATAPSDGGPDYTAASDGYVVHRFWPRCTASGVLRIGNDIVSLDDKAGARGIFIHAIQGMRPNLVACRWNFGYFSGTDASEGVSLMSMEFTTTYTHGNQTVNIGSVVADDRLVAVIADGSTEHLDTDPIDSDTGYNAPGKVRFSWRNGASLLPDTDKTLVGAEILLDLAASGKTKTGGRAFNGLIEKVDVLAQIPYLVKKVISYVAGTKPYIYQFLNPATATLTLPGHAGSEERKLTVKGYMFNEATFISPN